MSFRVVTSRKSLRHIHILSCHVKMAHQFVTAAGTCGATPSMTSCCQFNTSPKGNSSNLFSVRIHITLHWTNITALTPPQTPPIPIQLKNVIHSFLLYPLYMYQNSTKVLFYFILFHYFIFPALTLCSNYWAACCTILRKYWYSS